jgi:prolyl 4-hydroxylase
MAKEFWEKNQLNRIEENWGRGNTYLNSWESPTYLIRVDDNRLRGGGFSLRQKIWDAAKETLEDWTGEELSPTSMYGIRVYTNGATLLPHVDRLPLVSSAMLQVAQDVDEPWPMEIYDHDGVAHNITLDPGEMLLFESHSVMHGELNGKGALLFCFGCFSYSSLIPLVYVSTTGRPFPLKGRYYAMLFIHFEPIGHSLRHNANAPEGNVDRQYRQATEDGVGGQSADGSNLPPYIKRESPEEEHWRMQNPDGWKLPPQYQSKTVTKARAAAAAGDAETVKEEIAKAPEETKKEVINERDEKGWQLLHEGVSSGNPEVVEVLVQHGAQVNARTAGGRGETALHMAEKKFGMTHPIVEYLHSLGALNIGPEL